MNTEVYGISFTATEIELLLTALAYFEMAVIQERPEHVLESMRTLRERMLGTLRAVNPPAPNQTEPVPIAQPDGHSSDA